MRIVVIGGTGHVGSWLVPALVRDGHEVVNLSRGRSTPYRDDAAWDEVEPVEVDREAEDAEGTFARRVADLDADAVVDLVCFTEDSARDLVAGLDGHAGQLVHIGTIWVHGTLVEVPATEDAPRRPWGEYGTQKAAIERFLLAQSRGGGVPTSIVHPGHISGPGWPIITPQGTVDVAVWRRLATGGEVVLPDQGLATVHHVHAADVADLVQRVLDQPEAANHEAFHSTSPRALTLRGLAEQAAGWFGREADLRFAPFEDFLASVPEDHRDAARAHVARSHAFSMDKARRLLGHVPARDSLATVAEAVEWLRRDGRLGDDVPQVRVED